MTQVLVNAVPSDVFICSDVFNGSLNSTAQKLFWTHAGTYNKHDVGFQSTSFLTRLIIASSLQGVTANY
jgi:hypothetical protein